METELSEFKVEEYLPFLDPIISKWFNTKYDGLTDPQRRAIPIIHSGKNVLVSSPTGTGKTLTGFLSIINELFKLGKEGKLEDRIYCIYISPLKALANDINKNLNEPLREIYDLSTKEEEKVPKIRVAVRSGDTPQSERQKMLRTPPHILITTPESFALILSSLKFAEKIRDVKWVIIDEIHEISSTKRGALLSVNLERLQSEVGNFVRIGLSATQAPLDLIASYLCGYDGETRRPCEIVDVDAKKFLDLKTITPVADLTKSNYEVANDRMYEILADLIESHKTTLVFTNTRSGTEHVAMRLKARGIESIEAHHASLGKESRLNVENKLKNGELKCVITSTSLELGIDIGYIDLVVQIGSPKSVSKGIQRIGRSGHGINDMSVGRFLVFDLDDLMECAVLTKAAYDKEIDKVVIPSNPLDILSQAIVGMSVEKVWDVEDAFRIIRNAHCFHTLSREDYINTLNYLSGKIEDNVIYSKIWYDAEQGSFGKKKGSRMIYFMNIGTIPEESDYQVMDQNGRHLGQLSDKFVERLRQGDIFVLGARTYMFLKTRRNRVNVKDATGLRPTVPSWTGEMLPRSYDLGVLIGRFREEAADRIKNGEDIREWLKTGYHLDDNSANSLISYIKAQMNFGIPTENRLLVEGYKDNSGLYNIIFHVPLGRRVNDALSRVYALAVSNALEVNTRVTVTDNGFILASEKEIPILKTLEMVSHDSFVDYARRSVSNSEIFKQRFRHCAARSLMVLRKYKGYDISVARQQLRSDKLLRTLEEIKGFPVVKETYREVMEDMMDVPRAADYVRDVIEKKSYIIRKYSSETSPFSYGMILAGISDMVLMEDRSKLLRELQSKILDKVYGPDEIRFLIKDQKSVEKYYESKVPRITDYDSYMEMCNHFLTIDPFKNRINSPFPYASVGTIDLTTEAIENGDILSAYVRGPVWVSRDNYDIVRKLFSTEKPSDPASQKILQNCNGVTFNELKRKTELPEEELRDRIMKLESSYLIRRKQIEGITVHVLNDIEESSIDYDEALSVAILKTLSSYGPLTLDEIVIKLPVNEKYLVKALEELCKSETIVYDYITPVFAKQYILKDDLNVLLGSGPHNLLELRIRKFSSDVKDVHEYFDRYGYAYSIENIKARLKKFNIAEFDSMISKDEILYGKFMKHKWTFMAKWLAESLHDLRFEELENDEARIYELINSGEDTESRITSSSRLPAKLVRQILRDLEYRIAISRDKTKRIRIQFGIDRPINLPRSLKIFLEKMGPISKHEIGRNFWFYPDKPLAEANTKPLFLQDDFYYGGSNIDVVGKNYAILPVVDPLEIYLPRRYLNEIDYNYIFVENGKESVTMNINVSDNALWISNISGDTKHTVEFLQCALDIEQKFGCNNMIIANPPKSILAGPIPSAMKIEGNSLINGNFSLVEMEEEELFIKSATFQSPLSVRNPYDALRRAVFGIRSESESSLIGLKENLITDYFVSKLLYSFSGPFMVPALATLESISVYRALRKKELSEPDQEVIRTVMELGSASLSDIYVKNDMIKSKASQIIRKLFNDCILAKDFYGKYVFVPEIYSFEEAVHIILHTLINTIGFADTELINSIVGSPVVYDQNKAIKSLQKDMEVIAVAIPGKQKILLTTKDFLNSKDYKRNSRILMPKDIVILCFSDYLKRKLGTINVYVIIHNGELSAALKGRKFIKNIMVDKLYADEKEKTHVISEFKKLGYSLSFPKA